MSSKGSTKQLNLAAKEDENTQVVVLSGSAYRSQNMHRMIADGNGQYWTTPVSPDDAKKYQCPTANYKGDDMMKYDPTIETWTIPCASLAECR